MIRTSNGSVGGTTEQSCSNIAHVHPAAAMFAKPNGWSDVYLPRRGIVVSTRGSWSPSRVLDPVEQRLARSYYCCSAQLIALVPSTPLSPTPTTGEGDQIKLVFSRQRFVIIVALFPLPFFFTTTLQDNSPVSAGDRAISSMVSKLSWAREACFMVQCQTA